MYLIGLIKSSKVIYPRSSTPMERLDFRLIYVSTGVAFGSWFEHRLYGDFDKIV